MGNELVLSTDINVITAEINSYKQVAGQAIYEIGIRLKHARDKKIAEQKGGWNSWCENELNFTRRHANRYIKAVERFPNGTSMSHLGIAMLSEMSDLDDEQIQQPHTIPSTGENKTIDEMTVRELREVKKKLKEKEDYEKLLEEENSKLSQQLQQERNKPPQVKTEVVERVVEVDKTDYSKLQQLQNQLDTLQRKNSLADREINLLKTKLQDEQDDAEAYRKAKDELEKLYQTKDDLSRQIESATSISGLVVDIEHQLQGKLAPVKYSKAIYEQKDNPVVIENLREVIDRVESWCNEMKQLLPAEYKNGRVIIDGQVIESELM